MRGVLGKRSVLDFPTPPAPRPIPVYFAVLFLLFLVVLGFVLPKGAMSLVIQIMIFSILAMGYDLSLGFTNQCSLGHSVFFGGGAYGVVWAILHLKAGIFPSLFCSVLAGLIFALITGYISVRLSEAYFVIMTAIFFAVFHLLAMDLTWLTGGDDGLSVQLPAHQFGVREAVPLRSGGQLLFCPLFSYCQLPGFESNRSVPAGKGLSFDPGE